MHGCMALTYVKSPYAWDRSQFPNLVNSVPERVDWYHDSSSPDWWPSCMQLSFFLAFGKKPQISSCLIFSAVTREHNRWTYIYIGWLCRSLLFAWIYCFLYYAKRSSSHVRKTATREQNVRPIAQWRGKKNAACAAAAAAFLQNWKRKGEIDGSWQKCMSACLPLGPNGFRSCLHKQCSQIEDYFLYPWDFSTKLLPAFSASSRSCPPIPFISPAQ